MLISVTCPACNKRMKADAKLEGKRLRCPNPKCAQPFWLGENGETMLAVTTTAPKAAEPEVVDVEVVEPEVVEAEVVEVVEEASEAPAWQAEPPPVRQGGQAPQPAVAANPEVPPPLEELWEPPPVRRLPAEADFVDPAEVSVEEAAEEEAHQEEPQYAPIPSTGRKLRWLVLGFVLLGLVGTAGAVGYVLFGDTGWKPWGAGEANLKDQADDDYKNRRFLNAHKAYKELAEKHPNSADAPLFQFRAELTEIQSLVYESDPDVARAHSLATGFLDKHKQKPLYKEHRKDIWETLTTLTEAAAAKAERDADLKLLELAEDAFKRSQDVGSAFSDHVKVDANLHKRLAQARQVALANQEKKKLLEEFKELADQQAPGSAEQAQQRFEAAVKLHPRLADDAELNAGLTNFKANEANWVRYTKAAVQLERGVPPESSEGPTLIVCPVVKGAAGLAPTDDPVVLALARGILYALSQTNGEVRWAMRVGIDTHLLPQRMPASPPLPELALVLSSETNTVTAVDVQTGRIQWYYRMGASCPGGPILVGRRAYLPTADGIVHEIETVEGSLIGKYELGVPLTNPGTFDPVHRRLYVPADRKRICIIDVDKNLCAGVLYTGHSVGALRGAPVVVGSATGTTLALAEAGDLRTTRVRAYTLPVAGGEGSVLAEYQVPGWSWFAPYSFNGDTLGLVTDQGMLALFGLNRYTSERPIFFPIAPPLAAGEARTTNPAPTGRAQVVHVDLNQWWLLIGGALQRFQFDLYRQQLVPLAGDGLQLGTPLHESQQVGRTQRVLVVTQAANQPLCLATAIDGTRGTLQWQRQLGLVCAEPPLILGDDLAAIDQTGGLFHVELSKLTPSEGDWRVAGEWLAGGVEGAANPRLLPAPDRSFAVAVLYVPQHEQLILQKYEPGKGITWKERFQLESAPAGTPAVGSRFVIIPCRDGNFYEFPLQGIAKTPLPAAWRDRTVIGQPPGHALLISDDQLFITDGLRKLQRWERGAGDDQTWRKVPTGAIELPARLATAPLVLDNAGTKQICIGDENGVLYLCSTTLSGGRPWTRQWQTQGKITKGPFSCGTRIGCVVDGRKLICLDPSSDEILWTHESSAPGISGEPRLSGNLLLVSELSGAFTWLDPEKGTVQGRKQLKTHVVPSTAAMPLGTDQAFAPLSDGTILLLTAPKPE